MSAEAGAIVAGRYRLDELIGRGGMAAVFRAWDLRLSRSVAVKLLRPEILADADLALRFRREAHAATVLRHPNVVACLDTGTDGESPFLVMELVDGEDLAARLRREPRLPAGVAIGIARDVARGLAIAHVRGIVHRDVKPGNILLATGGRAMVTDFGIARIAAEAEATLPGTTLGSVHYFSPEQARGATTTPASDVYSLGLVLYEMLTGTRPFGGDSPAAIAIARIDAPAPSPRTVDPEIPVPLDAVATRALAQDPADRYANGGAFADALDELDPTRTVDPAGVTQRTAIPGWAGRSAGAAAAAGRPAARRPRRQARVAPLLAAAAGALAVVGVLTAMTLFGGEPGVAAVDATDRPTARPSSGPTTAPTQEETAVPATAEPAPTTAPTAAPATPAPAPGEPADLCDPDPGDSCPLAAGLYRPSRFEPSFTIALDDGWSTFRNGSELVVLERAEGYLTLASAVSLVYDGEDQVEVRSTARDLLNAIRDNDSVVILDETRVRIAGRRAVQMELVPAGDRTALFASGEDVYYAETTTRTRVLVFETRGAPVIVVLEGAGGFRLADFLDLATPSLATLAFD